jgi:hypothetical protein
MVGIDGIFLSIGGQEVTGFAPDAVDIAEPEDKVASIKGLDNIVWVRSSKKSQELIITVKLQVNSPSVRHLRSIEDRGAVVPFMFSWDDIAVEISALDAIVIETEGLSVTAEPDGFTFEIRVKNFTNFKGL